ncbi:MAG: RICIN domain-containing protein [Micromonosporaceae bacterium]
MVLVLSLTAVSGVAGASPRADATQPDGRDVSPSVAWHYFKIPGYQYCIEGHHGSGNTGWVGWTRCRATYYQVWEWYGQFWDGDRIRGVGSNRCLDANEPRSNGIGDVYMHDCNGGAYQTWRVIPDSGYVRIAHPKTGGCLYRSSEGTLWTVPCSSGHWYQLWRIVSHPDA